MSMAATSVGTRRQQTMLVQSIDRRLAQTYPRMDPRARRREAKRVAARARRAAR